MSSLARIRRVPRPSEEVPPLAPAVDLDRLAAVYAEAREHDRQAYELRREGEDIIRAARAAGVPTAQLAELSGISPQRAYQVLNGPTVAGGNGSDP